MNAESFFAAAIGLAWHIDHGDDRPLSALLDINNPDAPDDHDLSLVSNTLRDAIADARTDAPQKSPVAAENRRSSQLVRDRMRASW
nr:biotin-independent malonate decarboxylase subunit gamma [Klebsiella pneumoniae]